MVEMATGTTYKCVVCSNHHRFKNTTLLIAFTLHQECMNHTLLTASIIFISVLPLLSMCIATPLSGRPLARLGVNCRHILLYNLGVQQLFSGAPLAAFDSLLEVVQVYHANPRLWLRLAEASVSAHTKVHT